MLALEEGVEEPCTAEAAARGGGKMGEWMLVFSSSCVDDTAAAARVSISCVVGLGGACEVRAE